MNENLKLNSTQPCLDLLAQDLSQTITYHQLSYVGWCGAHSALHSSVDYGYLL